MILDIIHSALYIRCEPDTHVIIMGACMHLQCQTYRYVYNIDCPIMKFKESVPCCKLEIVITQHAIILSV